MIEALQYAFMQKALLGGALIAIASALIGTFLVLKRMALLGDGFAHAAFGGIALGMLLRVDPLASALAFTGAIALWFQQIVSKAKAYGDAATALILSFGMALAIVIIASVKGLNANIFSYLFGSILALNEWDLVLIAIVLALDAAFIALAYKKLSLSTFNEDIAKTSGVSANTLNNVLVVLAAVTVVVTMRAVGILLVSALLVIPALSALQLSRSFRQTLALACTFSVVSVIAGIVIAFYADIPAGATIVLANCAVFVLCVLAKEHA